MTAGSRKDMHYKLQKRNGQKEAPRSDVMPFGRGDPIPRDTPFIP